MTTEWSIYNYTKHGKTRNFQYKYKIHKFKTYATWECSTDFVFYSYIYFWLCMAILCCSPDLIHKIPLFHGIRFSIRSNMVIENSCLWLIRFFLLHCCWYLPNISARQRITFFESLHGIFIIVLRSSNLIWHIRFCWDILSSMSQLLSCSAVGVKCSQNTEE